MYSVAVVNDWVCCRFGFLEDPYPSSDLGLEQPCSGSSPLSFGVYVHYTGCAMVRPITSPLPCREDGLGEEMRDPSPVDTLTDKSPLSHGEDGDVGGSCHECPVYGFHWFWNHCYLQQRTSQAVPAEKHKELLEEFRSYCTNDSIMLPFACSQLLEQTETPPMVTRLDDPQ